MKLKYITTNDFKIKVAKENLEPLGIEVLSESMECPEIQADTIEEVAIYSAEYARDKLNENTLKNDSGLVIPALKNFPSAYTKYVENTLGVEGVLKLMEGVEDRSAYFLEALAYSEVDGKTHVFTSKTEGTLATEPNGEYGWSWDFIFIPKGEEKTLGNFNDDERWKFWDNKAYKKLAEYLKEKDINVKDK